MLDNDIAVIHGELAGMQAALQCLLEVLTAQQLVTLSGVLTLQAERIEAALLAQPVQDSVRAAAIGVLQDLRQACLERAVARG